MEFQDKNVVITGGASGIGLAVAKQLAGAGARLFLMSRNEQKAAAALEILGASAQFIFCDVASETSVAEAFAKVAGEVDQLHYAINNAGITAPYAPIATIQPQDWNRVIHTNLNGPLYCLQKELALISQYPDGAIVNVSSCAGVMPMANQAAYVASKTALNALTQVAAMENACDSDSGFAVRVNAVAPGPTLGGINSPERLAAHPENTQRKRDVTAMKRFAQPEEIADAIMFLLSKRSSYITGTVLSADGGYHIGKF